MSFLRSVYSPKSGESLPILHEFSIATSLIETILGRIKKEERVEKVLEVRLIIGKLTMLGKDQLAFCYEIITKGTLMEGSKLLVIETEVKVKCNQCGYLGAMSLEEDMLYHLFVPTLQCPSCGNSVQILEGNECLIKSVKCQTKTKRAQEEGPIIT